MKQLRWMINTTDYIFVYIQQFRFSNLQYSTNILQFASLGLFLPDLHWQHFSQRASMVEDQTLWHLTDTAVIVSQNVFFRWEYSHLETFRCFWRCYSRAYSRQNKTLTLNVSLECLGVGLVVLSYDDCSPCLYGLWRPSVWPLTLGQLWGRVWRVTDGHSHSFIMPMSTQRFRRQAWQWRRLSLVMVQFPLNGQVKLALRFILRLRDRERRRVNLLKKIYCKSHGKTEKQLKILHLRKHHFINIDIVKSS